MPDPARGEASYPLFGANAPLRVSAVAVLEPDGERDERARVRACVVKKHMSGAFNNSKYLQIGPGIESELCAGALGRRGVDGGRFVCSAGQKWKDDVD